MYGTLNSVLSNILELIQHLISCPSNVLSQGDFSTVFLLVKHVDVLQAVDLTRSLSHFPQNLNTPHVTICCSIIIDSKVHFRFMYFRTAVYCSQVLISMFSPLQNQRVSQRLKHWNAYDNIEQVHHFSISSSHEAGSPLRVFPKVLPLTNLRLAGLIFIYFPKPDLLSRYSVADVCSRFNSFYFLAALCEQIHENTRCTHYNVYYKHFVQ